MTQEQVLALCNSDEEKERVLAAYTTADRFSKEVSFEKMKTSLEVRAEIELLAKNYNSRLKAKAKRDEKKLKEKNLSKQVDELFTQAAEVNMKPEELIEAMKDIIKKKYNKNIQDKIAELQSKLIK